MVYLAACVAAQGLRSYAQSGKKQKGQPEQTKYFQFFGHESIAVFLLLPGVLLNPLFG